jgi:hypothetical protein
MVTVNRSYLDDDESATARHGPFHQSAERLEATLDWIRQSPRETGELKMIVRRPALGAREELEEAELSTVEGLIGDSWIARPSRRSADGGPHPEMQLNLMNARAVDAVAGAVDRWSLAGDQLLIDMDLSEESLPAGTQLAIGDAVIEITSEPHTGCAKFAARFGPDARRFVNSDAGKELKLRGINAKVVRSGSIVVGSAVVRL